ncbi:hypothetical protein [Streptomyces sp. NBC_01618]|uniref:hypothetical protein n=1 Tax=Streptomyces sp. NBC_01618 TaxID=2975900 RepID=UPI003869031C|nr:hypothetical protein OH735_27090 [Streptomyces sp. NBC_01618]
MITDPITTPYDEGEATRRHDHAGTTHKADAPAHGPSALFDLHSTAMQFVLLAVFLVLLWRLRASSRASS